MRVANIFEGIRHDASGEVVDGLVSTAGVRIERIVSNGQASPPGFWYDQPAHEWVIVLQGSAGLLIEGAATPLTLGPGDYVNLPAHTRHRVEWTNRHQQTVWLAVHYE